MRFSDCAAAAFGQILLQEGKPAGKVTSVTKDPETGETIGLAYVRTQFAVAGNQLELPGTGTAQIIGLSQMFGAGQDF